MPRSVLDLRLRLARHRVPPTAFPLAPAHLAALAASLRGSTATMSPGDSAPGADRAAERDFPEVEELTAYWGIVRHVTQLLSPYNPIDKYFQWSDYQRKEDRGLLCIIKDLFAIWVAIHKHPRVILEIGCRTGKSIITQLLVHSDPSACTVFLIDPFIEMGSPKAVRRNLERLRIPTKHVHFFVGYSAGVFPRLMAPFPGRWFDYVLVDGSHRKEDVARDLEMIAPYVREGGYVVLDDIGSYGPGIGYALLDVWEAWKAAHRAEFAFREYLLPWGFAVARGKAN